MTKPLHFGEMTAKKDILYFLAILILFLLLFHKFILTDSTFYVRDVTRLEIPTRRLCTQLLREGNFALWTEAFGNGQPFLANPKNAVFYPTSWFFLFLPFFLAFKLHYVIHFLAAYLGIYYLGRSYALSRPASFLAASSFLAGGPYLSSLEFYNHIAALAWLPWILLSQRMSYRPTPWRIIVPAIFWTLCVLSGSPEIALITLIFALFQIVFLDSDKRRAGTQALLALALSLFVSAVQVLPTLDFWNNSVRKSVQTAEWPLEAVQILNVPFPNILGDDRSPGHRDFWAAEFFDRGNPLHYSLYIGFAPFLMMFFGLAKPPPRLARFLAFSIALFLLLSLGRYSILYPLIQKTPLLSSIFYPVKFIIGSAFALPFLSALGFDRLFRSERTQKKRAGWLFAGSSFLLILFILFRAQVVHFFRRLFVISTDESAGELSASLGHGLGLLMLYTSILLLSALRAKTVRKAAFFFLAVLMVDLVYHNRGINPVMLTDFFREPLILGGGSGATSIYRDESIPDRLTPSFKTAEGAVRYYRRSLYPFCGCGEGIRYLNNNDSYLFYSSDYQALLRAIAGSGKDRLVKILRAQGCAYSVGHTPWPGLSADSVSTPADSLYIHKIGDHVPSAYVVHHAVEAQSFEEAFRLLDGEEFGYQNTAILKSPGSFPADDRLPDRGKEEISIIRDLAAEKQFLVSISSPGFLIVPGNAAPGWKAKVDGRPAAVRAAYPASRAIPVPAGSHRISMKYQPGSFLMGSWVTLFSLVVIGLFLTLSWLRNRAKARGEESQRRD
jgi:hypothetical protein